MLLIPTLSETTSGQSGELDLLQHNEHGLGSQTLQSRPLCSATYDLYKGGLTQLRQIGQPSGSILGHLESGITGVRDFNGHLFLPGFFFFLYVHSFRSGFSPERGSWLFLKLRYD